jgi:hypothetical protein
VLVSTQIPDLPPAALAYLVGQWLLGLAIGCAPLVLVWHLPPLYESGVVYRLEASHGEGLEDFALPSTTYARGWGDCDDLVLWRVAELRAGGERATVRADYLDGEVHVQVRRASGALEDPSRILTLKEGNRWPDQLS